MRPRPPRVLSLSTVFPNPVQPGHGVFVHQRLRHLAAHCDLTVVAPVPYFPLATGRMRNRPAGIPARRTEPWFEVHHPRFWTPPAVGKSLDGYLYAASVLPLVRRLHAEQRFDLIDAHFAYPDGFAAVQLGRRLGVPVSVTLRGTLADLRHRPSRRWALRRTLREADVVVSVSASLADDAAAVGAERSRVHVVPNGIDAELFRPLPQAAARERLALPSDRQLIVAVGALREVKGHHHLLRALQQVRHTHPRAMLAVVGGASVSDDRSEQLRALAADLGLADHVVWAGPQPHAEVPWWIAAADVFALASLREGCCNAILEALACGRPVVTTAVGGNGESIHSAHLGRLVPPADPTALAGALAEAFDARWEPERIRAAVQARTWEGTARAVLDAWSSTLGHAPDAIAWQGSSPVTPASPMRKAS